MLFSLVSSSTYAGVPFSEMLKRLSMVPRESWSFLSDVPTAWNPGVVGVYGVFPKVLDLDDDAESGAPAVGC